jgi:hypothetical protein
MIFPFAQYLSYYLSLSLVALFTIGCMESRVSSTDELPGSQVRGTIRLLSEDNSFAINKNLVLVKLEGTGFETLTDTAGKWTLNLVPKGTYTLSYSKQGYSSAKRFSIRPDGAMPIVVNPMTLVQIPPYTVDTVKTSITNDSMDILCILNTPALMNRRVILYFDSIPIDPLMRNQYVFTDISLTIAQGEIQGSIKIPLARFYNSGLRSGQTIHCLASSIIRYEATADESYFAMDPITKKTIFWNVNINATQTQSILP